MTDVTDNFNRASLGSDWVVELGAIVTTGSVEVVGNSVGNDSTMRWASNVFGDDHYSQIDIATGDFDGIGAAVRHQSGAASCYSFWTDNAGTMRVFEITAGSFAALGADYTTNTSPGDTLKLDATGSTLTPYINGSPQSTRSDASFTSGAAGVHLFNTICQGDDWLGGPVNTDIRPFSEGKMTPSIRRNMGSRWED